MSPDKTQENKNDQNNIPVVKEDEKLLPLNEIYQAEENKEGKEYFSTMDRAKVVAKWKKFLIVFFSILAVFAAAALAGFFVFQSKTKFTGEHIRLEITGPESVSSGDTFTLTVAYENNETVALKNPELTLSFPEGFTLEQAVPAPSDEFKNTWPLSDIGVGQKGTIIVRGRIVGEDSGTKTVTGKLNFEPANFSSPFDTRASYTVRIQESALKMALNFPPRAAANTEISGTITLQNESEEELKDVRLEVFFPADFSLTEAKPKASEGSRWDFDSVVKGKPHEIAIRGILHGTSGDLKELRAKASIRSEKNEFVVQTDTNVLITVVDPRLETSLTVNNRSANFSLDWGETLDVVLNIKNAGEQTIRDATATLTLDSAILDWGKVKWGNPGKRQKNKITWTKTEAPDLTEIAPDANASITFSVPILDTPPKNVSANDLMIKLSGEVVSSNVTDLDGSTVKAITPAFEVRLNTQVQLKPEARYLDDEYQPVGSGPVPPQVGKTTTYQISWYISNASNEVTDVKAQTTLPVGAFWVGQEQMTSGSISFDPTTRQVSWTINRVPARSGLDLPGLSATFLVSVTPTAGDLGKSLNLIDQTTLEAVDSFTKEVIEKRFDVLTTDIPTDPANAGKGKVIEAENANMNQ